MRYAAFLFAALLFTAPADGQRAFQYLGGPPIETLRNTPGTYVLMRDIRTRDTLLTWVQHVEPGARLPDSQSAKHADMVVWCHPDAHPHDRHVLPDAEGDIYFYARRDTVWVAPQPLKYAQSHAF
jgi:hypothetical protein